MGKQGIGGGVSNKILGVLLSATNILISAEIPATKETKETSEIIAMTKLGPSLLDSQEIIWFTSSSLLSDERSVEGRLDPASMWWLY